MHVGIAAQSKLTKTNTLTHFGPELNATNAWKDNQMSNFNDCVFIGHTELGEGVMALLEIHKWNNIKDLGRMVTFNNKQHTGIWIVPHGPYNDCLESAVIELTHLWHCKNENFEVITTDTPEGRKIVDWTSTACWWCDINNSQKHNDFHNCEPNEFDPLENYFVVRCNGDDRTDSLFRRFTNPLNFEGCKRFVEEKVLKIILENSKSLTKLSIVDRLLPEERLQKILTHTSKYRNAMYVCQACRNCGKLYHAESPCTHMNTKCPETPEILNTCPLCWE